MFESNREQDTLAISIVEESPSSSVKCTEKLKTGNDCAMHIISVVVPTYNRRHIVSDAVDSILAQRLPPGWTAEAVVVDDASADGTADFLRDKYGSRITLIQHPKNRGEGAARNSGIKGAAGDWVCFLDSDDLFLPDSLYLRVQPWIDNPLFDGATYGGSYYDDKLAFPLESLPSGRVLSAYVNTPFLNVSSFLIPKRYIFAAGMLNEKLTNMPDVLMIMKLMTLCEFHAVHQAISCIRKQTDSVSHDDGKIISQGLSFLDCVQSDATLLVALGTDWNALRSRVLHAYLAALYHSGLYRKFLTVWREQVVSDLPGFSGWKWRRRHLIAVLLSITGR